VRGTNKLSAVKIARLRKPGRYGDGGGLWLQVKPGGTKSWLLRYMRDGRARTMGLGPVDLIGLAEARERARQARRLLFDGVDPIDARSQERLAACAAAARATSFATAVERYPISSSFSSVAGQLCGVSLGSDC
jgi:hypothetical protein